MMIIITFAGEFDDDGRVTVLDYWAV